MKFYVVLTVFEHQLILILIIFCKVLKKFFGSFLEVFFGGKN